MLREIVKAGRKKKFLTFLLTQVIQISQTFLIDKKKSVINLIDSCNLDILSLLNAKRLILSFKTLKYVTNVIYKFLHTFLFYSLLLIFYIIFIVTSCCKKDLFTYIYVKQCKIIYIFLNYLYVIIIRLLFFSIFLFIQLLI